jgi:predicted ribosome-associated RNA-binding protein Tma20
MEESERTLAALKENEGALETLREQNEVVKGTQKQEIEYYNDQKKALLQKKEELMPRLRALEVHHLSCVVCWLPL